MLAHEIIREFAEEIIMNHDHEGMEAILYTDGEYWFRPIGSMWFREDQIMVKIPLGQTYWGDSPIWGEDPDDLIQRDHIMDDIIQDIYFRIEEWKLHKDKLKGFIERALD